MCDMMQSRCHINDLPEEVTAIVMEYVGTGFLGLLQFVSKSFRRVCLRFWKSMGGGNRIYIGQFCSSVSYLKWALHNGGYERSSDASDDTLMRFAARLGQVEVMAYLRQLDPPFAWSTEVCFEASHGGHLHALQWLRSQNPPCPWDDRVVGTNIMHIDILLWMKSLPQVELQDISYQPHMFIHGAVQNVVWDLGDSIQQQEDFEPMMDLLKKCRGARDIVAVCLEVLFNLVESDNPLINQHIAFIGPFALEVMKSIKDDTAHTAAMLLSGIITRRPHFLVKKDMIKMLIDGFSDTFVSDIWFHSRLGQGSAEGLSDESDTPIQLEVQDQTMVCIDLMAQQVPTKSLINVALAKFHELIQSSDPLRCKAGYVLLGCITEGCADSLSMMLADIVPLVVKAAHDTNYSVREGAQHSMIQLAQFCQPAIWQHHTSLARAIMTGLQDPMTSVQRLACLFAEQLFESLSSKLVVQYLPDLIPKLHSLMCSNCLEVQRVAFGAIGPIASMAADGFLPYLQESVTILTDYVNAKDTKDIKQVQLKGYSVEVLGQFAVAASRKDFAPYLKLSMNSIVDLTEVYCPLDDPILEYAYISIANISRTMEKQEDFKSYLPAIVPKLMESIETSFLSNVKVGAFIALGSLARYTQELMAQYMDRTLELIGRSLEVSPPEVHCSAVGILHHCLIVVCSAEGLRSPAPKSGGVLTIRGKIAKTLTMMMEWIWPIISTSTHDKTVTSAFGALKEIVQYIGVVALTLRDPPTFKTYNELLQDMTIKYLQNTAPCQRFMISEHDDDGEDDHHDPHVLPAVCDHVEALAKMYGEAYLDTFELYIPHLLKYTEDTRSYSDSAMAIGTFAMVIQGIGSSAVKHIDLILPALQRDCHDAMVANRQNACYCLSVIVDCIPNELLDDYIPSFIEWISPIAVRSADEDMIGLEADVDNALAALSRIVKRCHHRDVVGDLLPLVLAGLPLNSDFEELPAVYNMLVTLVTAESVNTHTISFFGEILVIFAHVLTEEGPYPSNSDVKASVTECLRKLSSSDYAGSLDIYSALDLLSSTGEVDSVQAIQACFS